MNLDDLSGGKQPLQRGKRSFVFPAARLWTIRLPVSGFKNNSVRDEEVHVTGGNDDNGLVRSANERY
jgi:hypothetical protein